MTTLRVVTVSFLLPAVLVTGQTNCDSFNCHHNSVCQDGEADYGRLENFSYLSPNFLDEKSHEGQHCECVGDFTGVACKRKFTICDQGSGFACFHGSTCVDLGTPTGGQTKWGCDCSTAEWLNDDEELFAGVHCEYRASDECEQLDWFCVNGGDCNDDAGDNMEKCTCPNEWFGPHCEFHKNYIPGATELGDGDCDAFKCHHGSTCQDGEADYGELENFSYLSPNFLNEKSHEGQHCECVGDYSGVACKREYTICDQASGFACFHGSTCVNLGTPNGGQTKWGCDCSTAAWLGRDEQFAGIHCEYRKSDQCNTADWFCVNGGFCYEDPDKPKCDCPEDWFGPHCEFHKSYIPGATEMTNTDCDSFKCHHGSTCQDGEADYGELENYSYHGPNFLDDKSYEGQHCECVGDYSGVACKRKYTICDQLSGFACFHGSTCVDLDDKWGCDCSTTEWLGREEQFAGRHCEYRKSDQCNTIDWFCVNGGECNESGGGTSAACDCPKDWFGPHCEFHKDYRGEMSENDCGDYKCRHGSVCTDGDADYGQLEKFPYLSPNFLDIKSYEGQHCECVDDWTGVGCKRKFTICDTETGFPCFHGSECVNLGGPDGGEGGSKWGCDCKTAEWQGRKEHFAGLHCEYRANDVCAKMDKDGLEEARWFCTNGGECNDDAERVMKKCDCPGQWFGPHCEYHRLHSPAEIEQYKPDQCTLKCRNGGKCVFGLKDYAAHHNKNDASIAFTEERHEDGMHCVCPDGYTGLICQIPAKKCGNRLWCYNGADCAETKLPDGTLKKYCDCSSAATNKKSYAGLACQHQSGVFCNPDEGNRKDMSFCVNGGTCWEEGNQHLGCDCEDGWSGQHCEFKEGLDPEATTNPECKLQCMNGGECNYGVKDYGQIEKFDVPFKAHENMEHCTCPIGFTGLDCSVPVTFCSATSRQVCFYGSACESTGGVSANGKDEFICKCGEGTGPDGRPVAGRYCQSYATDICTEDEELRDWHSFCTNGGTCVNGDVKADEAHGGCYCRKGWTGEFCEERDIKFIAGARSSAESLKKNMLVKVGATVGVGFSAALMW